MRAPFAIAACALSAAAPPVAAQPGLTMTCHPIYKGNDLGPQVYRVEGVELVKTDLVRSTPIVMSSSIRRQPLERAVAKGKVVYTTASHRIRGPILVRTVYWLNADRKVTRTMTETYDFDAKTIRGLTGDVERCR